MQQNARPMTYKTAKLLCFASLGSLPIYIFMIWFLEKQGQVLGNAGENFPLSPSVTFWIVLCLTFALPIGLQSILGKNPPKSASQYYSRQYLLFVAAQTGAVLGVMLFIFFGVHNEFYLLFIASPLIAMKFFPQEKKDADFQHNSRK